MDFDYLKQKRILLVDDEQELLDMVSSIFANEGFCNVKTAKTVKEALCIAETFQPELAEPSVFSNISSPVLEPCPLKCITSGLISLIAWRISKGRTAHLVSKEIESLCSDFLIIS